jgi:arylsulfatase A-like enzyme
MKGEPTYNEWLRGKGYVGDNPWNDFANAAEGPNGEILSGWSLRNSAYPARVREEHSETAYITDRDLDFVKESGDQPWLLHLSYIKPHWPYMAPAPFHNMYGRESFAAAIRSENERLDPHPVYRAFMDMDVSRAFSRDEVRDTVLSPYMGLVSQIDYHVGRVVTFLEESGRIKNTIIVFTSDHGDYLGDHWLGEKELFHEQSVRIPLIAVDPDSSANRTRGSVNTNLVETIDLVPTFLDALGQKLPSHRLEERSLLPTIRSGQSPSRSAVFSELDYAFYKARLDLGVGPSDARCYMIRDQRWKYIHFKSYRPQLFDLENDPLEFEDLGNSEAHAGTRAQLYDTLVRRLLDRRNRVAMTDDEVIRRTDGVRALGVLIGEW